jgi:hypothetical protein
MIFMCAHKIEASTRGFQNRPVDTAEYRPVNLDIQFVTAR